MFHSLSKRSNLPGLRSGFVAGDAHLIAPFKRYRTYHGCAMSLPLQHASITAWRDEAHVRANRDAYREKFAAVTEILAPVLDFPAPEASFYLWPAVPGGDDEAFTRALFAEENVSVLPGSYMGRATAVTAEASSDSGVNPGAGRIRLALVADVDATAEAARRLRRFTERWRAATDRRRGDPDMMTLYGIKACDTCRRARKALEARGVPFQVHDLREDGLSAALLEHPARQVPLMTLLNKRSTTWRQLDETDKAELDANSARELMLEHPTLIKRPLLDTGEDIRVGYRDGDYDDLDG